MLDRFSVHHRGLAWLLRHWFPPGQLRTFLAWFACLFSYGCLDSVQFALPDGPSVVLIALAIDVPWLASHL